MTATYRPVLDARPGEVMSVDTVRLDEQRAYVRVSGDIDLSTGAPLWAVLHGHLSAGRRYLRLDLSGVQFLDASALSGLAQVHRAALERRGTLVVLGVTDRVARLLRITGLDGVLFIGGPRTDADPGEPEPEPDSPAAEPRTATVWPARPVPWTPPTAARSTAPASPGRPEVNRPTTG